MNYKEEIEQISKDIQSKKIEKAKLEERQKTLEEDLAKVTDELAEEGLTEDMLEEWLEEQREYLTQEIEKCKQILNS